MTQRGNIFLSALVIITVISCISLDKQSHNSFYSFLRRVKSDLPPQLQQLINLFQQTSRQMPRELQKSLEAVADMLKFYNNKVKFPENRNRIFFYGFSTIIDFPAGKREDLLSLGLALLREIVNWELETCLHNPYVITVYPGINALVEIGIKKNDAKILEEAVGLLEKFLQLKPILPSRRVGTDYTSESIPYHVLVILTEMAQKENLPSYLLERIAQDFISLEDIISKYKKDSLIARSDSTLNAYFEGLSQIIPRIKDPNLGKRAVDLLRKFSEKDLPDPPALKSSTAKVVIPDPPVLQSLAAKVMIKLGLFLKNTGSVDEGDDFINRGMGVLERIFSEYEIAPYYAFPAAFVLLELSPLLGRDDLADRVMSTLKDDLRRFEILDKYALVKYVQALGQIGSIVEDKKIQRKIFDTLMAAEQHPGGEEYGRIVMDETVSAIGKLGTNPKIDSQILNDIRFFLDGLSDNEFIGSLFYISWSSRAAVALTEIGKARKEQAWLKKAASTLFRMADAFKVDPQTYIGNFILALPETIKAIDDPELKADLLRMSIDFFYNSKGDYNQYDFASVISNVVKFELEKISSP